MKKEIKQMNILFLTVAELRNVAEQGIYNDLMKKFQEEGHEVYIVSPLERRKKRKSTLKEISGMKCLGVKIGNITKTNIIEKGISTILIESQYKKAIKRYFGKIKFDMVIYSTPPITFAKVVSYIKKRDNARSYLLLKDIFPQNAVDLGMFTLNSIYYKFFRKKEIELYKNTDYIGCMSQANVDYIIKHNSFIEESRVHVSPNTITPIINLNICEDFDIRKEYGINKGAKVFIYGGNLGKPQGVDFIIKCLKDNINKEDRFFIISGSGTEYHKLEKFMDLENPSNVRIMNGLPKIEYEEMARRCDVGLIFLDHRFTIPNFPSRLLSYMQHALPVIACTDKNTDIGKVIEAGEFGWWTESNDAKEFTKVIDEACCENLEMKKENSRKYLEKHYTSEVSYSIIMDAISGIEKQ